LVDTEIGTKSKGFLATLVWESRRKYGTTADVPSRTIQHLASAPFEEITADLYWKNSAPKPPSRASQDPILATRLWEQSCRLCGISDYFVF
jgi:hypothetical protein